MFDMLSSTMAPDPKSESEQDSLPRIILRIPGPWTSIEQLQAAMTKAGDEFVVPAVGTDEELCLLHQPSGQRFALSAMERDDEIVDLFADSGRASPAEIRALRDHQVKVFVSGPGGSFDAARMFLAIGTAFAKACALAIMVDNCGNCHSPRDWLSLAGDKKMGGMYWGICFGDCCKR
jgi:hypothetical protein